ncbi:MAG TPA: hypothetical protein VGS21_06935, partial [Acidimicrobiales bacterium]|nr:hypothetical protein [Acidimicrobiales bacterium]
HPPTVTIGPDDSATAPAPPRGAVVVVPTGAVVVVGDVVVDAGGLVARGGEEVVGPAEPDAEHAAAATASVTSTALTARR